MADVIVYPWHGLPERFIDVGGYYAPQVTTAFDADGPILHNQFALAERLADNGDGTYSRVVTTDTDVSDKLVHANGLLQRYSDMGDGTFCRVVATTVGGGTDVFVSNVWGLLEKYVDLENGTYALLVGPSGADAAVYNEYGLALGFDTSGGFALPVLDGVYGIVDTDATANEVSQAANNDDPIGITALLSGAVGAATYSIVSQTVAGTFQVNSSTGVTTVADNTKITTL